MDAKNLVNMHVDKDHDVIFCSVGMYKMFLANGSEGLEAKQLYDHLIFTARLQETNMIYANTGYISNGLGWGTAKVKRAKSFLQKKGLISYVKRRNSSGQISETFIQVNFCKRDPRIEEEVDSEDTRQLALFGFITTGSESEPVEGPSQGEKTRGSISEPVDRSHSNKGFQADNGENSCTGPSPEHQASGSISEPVDRKGIEATGSIYHPVASQASGSEQQMLKDRNKMLKERKRKEPSLSAQSNETEEIASAFRNYYFERFKIKPAELTSEEQGLIVDHLARFGKLKLMQMLYAFFADSIENIAWFAQKAGYRYKVFSSQIEALAIHKVKESSQPIPEAPEVCPTCGGKTWKSTVGERMCVSCKTYLELKDGKWTIDPDSIQADPNGFHIEIEEDHSSKSSA